MKQQKEESYEAAFGELKQLVAEIEEGSIGIDALGLKVKRAAELIKICRNRLKQTEIDVQAILKDLESAD